MQRAPGPRSAPESAFGSAWVPSEALAWVYSFVHPHRARLALVLLLSLISTTLALAQPYITKYLIDEGLIAGNFKLLLSLSLLMVFVGIMSTVLGGWNRWHYVNVSAKILMSLRQSVFSHLLSLSPRYFAKTRGGDLIARLDADVAEVQRFGVDTLLAAVNGVFALLGALVLMINLSPRLTLLALILIPLIIVFLKMMRPRVEHQTRTVRQRASDVTSFFIDTLAAMKLVQSAGAEEREASRLTHIQDLFRQDTLRLQMTNYVTATVPGVLNSITTAVVFIVGGYMTINGQLTVGSLIAFSAYMVRATGPIQTLLGLYVAFQRAVVSLERLNDIRGEHAEVSDSADAIALNGDTTPDIVFDNVSFSYTQDHPVLRNVSFTLPAACKVLVRGPSGVGKTTLVDLLHRHYDPSEGKIRLGNIDLRHYQLQSLRRRIAVIAQDTALLSGSILDNIVYANPDATEADMSDVLVRAQLADYIADLPDGMNTQVGVRGTALSGGQRQRIAIARALLQSPLVIILDEATTGVDPTTERKIIDAVDDIFVNRTRLIIGHRPQLNEHYDLVLTLTDDGKMSLSGPA